MKVRVVSRSGKDLLAGALSLEDEATVDDLKAVLHRYNKKWIPARQRLTLSPTPFVKGDVSQSGKGGGAVAGAKQVPVVLEGKKKLSDYVSRVEGSDHEIVVVLKDLGPQVGYSTVFFWEYFGPLVLYPLPYFLPHLFYWGVNGRKATHTAQHLAVYYWSFHFAKRIFETFFVHRFSHATMPIFNLFRNCAYYWSFALFVSYFVNHPLYSPVSDRQVYAAFAAALVCQLGNLQCHVILRNLRPASGVGGYSIPRGFLFDFITCPNYTTEILGWLFFNVATVTLPGVLFMVAGLYQMAQWAVAKHKRLKKLFDGKEGRQRYPRRWIMLPPFF